MLKNREGSLLLFSVIMLGVMFMIGFVIAALVYREINLARIFDDSLVSFYAGESGWERSMDILGERRKDDDQLANALAAIEAFAPPASPKVLANSGGTYYIDPAGTTSVTSKINLVVFNKYGTQVELFNPDNPFSFLQAESVQFRWLHPLCGGSSRMEVTFYEFDSATFGIEDDSVYKQVFTCGVEAAPAGYDCQATSNWPAANTNYIMRVKALDCTLLGVNTVFYNADDGQGGGGTIVDVPSRVAIVSVGEGNFSQRSISAKTKWIPSASGLVDYVLFSVEQVNK
ncbi:MAG: hypothetical protein ABIG66_02225 [Candidatus Kerfeldbacteria bacterium]